MNYFYRIEFQACGAPHAHILLWATNENGKPPPTLTSITEDNFVEKVKDYHNSTISCCVSREEDRFDKELKSLAMQSRLL